MAKIQPVQGKYDTDTKSGLDLTAQNRWDGWINTAFTSPRTPPATAADGVPLKARLLDVLRAGGVVVP